MWIEEREAGVVVMDDALESIDDAAEKFGQFTAADEDIVDVEKSLQAIAFARELRLVSLGGFKIESVIHGDGDLAGDALHELQLGIR